MEVNVLVENYASSDEFIAEHGLSLYIKFNDKNIMFDLGQSDVFIKNAKKLNLKIEDVDYLIISHGHNDHGGGLNYFLDLNKKAKVYLHENAFEDHFSKKSENRIVNIGLDKNLELNKNIVLLNKNTNIYEGVSTLTNVRHLYDLPLTNGNLYQREDKEYKLDDFVHEQNLVLKEKDEYTLIVGCSHNGVKNIIEEFKLIYGFYPNNIIGGFHLTSRTQRVESDDFIKELAKYLLNTKAHCYTCHCTGKRPFEIMKTILKDNIDYISAGNTLKI